MPVRMSTDQSLMTGKIFSCILQAELLRPLSGQPAFFHIFWIKTQNVMMGFDFIIGLIFTVLCVQFFTFHIKSKRITVDAVQSRGLKATLRLFYIGARTAHEENVRWSRVWGAGCPVDTRLARTGAERRPKSPSSLPGKQKSRSEF